MTPPPLSPAWFSQFTDPYAILGVSVTADDRRILKRYHQVAKHLHPDVQGDTSADQAAFITQTLAKLVNPAYQRLKQEKQRSEILATLRFRVRRLIREGQFEPQSEVSRHLQTVRDGEVDTVYEHTLHHLGEFQYASATHFAACTRQIGDLNLVYVQRKLGESIIREKRKGLVGLPTQGRGVDPGSPPTQPTPPSPAPPSEETPYADRHYQRAMAHLQARNAPAAIQELKDALKLDPQNSDYHTLMGQAYLLNKLPGMAKVHVKQALRLDPNNSVAQKYAHHLNLTRPSPPPTATPTKGFLGRLFSNPRP